MKPLRRIPKSKSNLGIFCLWASINVIEKLVGKVFAEMCQKLKREGERGGEKQSQNAAKVKPKTEKDVGNV